MFYCFKSFTIASLGVIFSLTCFLSATITTNEVIISEFQASNSTTIEDEDGDSSDWIEIYNPTTTVANLTGYALTDDAANKQKWVFPITSLEPGAYLVVFASGKDRAVSDSELHTNFSLSSGGEYLALVKPDGVTLTTEFAPEYPALPTDVSYGYDSSELDFRYFQPSTPGLVNGASFEGIVDDLVFSSERGIYEDAFLLSMSSGTVDAEIRYTLDGTEPTATSGLIYTLPLSVSETTVIRALAVKSGMLPTNSVTHSYIFPADVVTQPEMRTEITGDPIYGPKVLESLSTVPTIALSFEGDDIDRDEIPLSVEMINFESGSTQLNAGAARFGSFHTDFAKRSFRLHFRSQYGPSRLEFPLFNNREYNIPAVETFDSLDIRAGNHDMVLRGGYLGNPFADDSMIDMGNIAPHGRFVNIYFNGQYRGMYHLRERWSAAMLSDYFPGEEDDYDTINANNRGHQFETGDLQDGDLDDWNEIQDRLEGPNRFEGVRNMLDLNDYIDFMILFTYGTCESEFRAGGSLSNGVGFKFFLKDADGFLQPPFPIGNNLPFGGRNIGIYDADHNGPLNAMTQLREEANSDFMTLLGDRIHRHMFNNGALTPAAASARLTRRLDEARLPYFSEIARWESHFSRASRTPEEWEEYQRHFFDTEFPVLTNERVDLFRDVGMYPDLVAPSYSQHGGAIEMNGLVTISVPSTVSKIYYLSGPADTNLDIYENSLDPRLPGGAVNPLATVVELQPTGDSTSVHSIPVTLSGSGWLLARSFNEATGEWSALNEAFFELEAVPANSSNLIVSKIHYNPADPTGSELLVEDDADEYEFLELMNVGDEFISLENITITGGITFTFGESNDLAPGGRIVIVENQEAFEARYASSLGVVQFGKDILGESEYGGKLSNGGEELILTDAEGTLIRSFTYDDRSPWPTAPDGLGYSLVLQNPAVPIPDHNVGSNWAASAEVGGSPGSGSDVGILGDPNADNDNDGNSALLEYVLGGDDEEVGELIDLQMLDYTIEGVTQKYLTASFLVNQHIENVYDLVAEISSDIEGWNPDGVLLVSELDNDDGTSTRIYRSMIAEEDHPEGKEFIRVRVIELP